MKRSRISLLLLLASFALAGCRDVRSFLWRQTHHHGGYVRHERSVRRMGAFSRKPVPPPRPAKPRHRR
jgi:outer membrane protein assembly factor BamE (lipoprotein component of BamABCDE complex)